MVKHLHNLLTNFAKKSPDKFLQGFENLAGVELLLI
jgi:hypothetical protein